MSDMKNLLYLFQIKSTLALLWTQLLHLLTRILLCIVFIKGKLNLSVCKMQQFSEGAITLG